MEGLGVPSLRGISHLFSSRELRGGSIPETLSRKSVGDPEGYLSLLLAESEKSTCFWLGHDADGCRPGAGLMGRASLKGEGPRSTQSERTSLKQC